MPERLLDVEVAACLGSRQGNIQMLRARRRDHDDLRPKAESRLQATSGRKIRNFAIIQDASAASKKNEIAMAERPQIPEMPPARRSVSGDQDRRGEVHVGHRLQHPSKKLNVAAA
ncbi:MAG TPA: hypothetical protein VFG26_04990 [Hyphomicrobium sp.]|nr:hypothetical protein [Hyphomicrobium sp.]HET6388695.1 hypothetical protein [Hyphomicrobium sp.]